MTKTNFNTSMLINITASAILICLVFYILYIGRQFLLPFISAVVVWYIIISIANGLQSISIRQWHLNNALAILISVCITLSVVYTVIMMMVGSIYNIAAEAPLYQQKISSVLSIINERYDLKLSTEHLLAQINLNQLFTQLALALTALIQNMTLIAIYVLFLLIETHSFGPKLRAMFKDNQRYQKTRGLIQHIKKDIHHYLKIKTFASLLTAVCSYVVLISFNIPEATFWAILIFLLNYIPTIGSIVAVMLVMIVSAVQFDSFSAFLLMATLLAVIQFLVGNILEPKITGATLNLSPIIILLSLAIWGNIWGIIGMFLCVPLMTITNIVLAQFERTRPLAVLFSADGRLLTDTQNTY